MANDFIDKIVSDETYKKIGEANRLLDNLVKAIEELSAIGIKVDGTIDSSKFDESFISFHSQNLL